MTSEVNEAVWRLPWPQRPPKRLMNILHMDTGVITGADLKCEIKFDVCDRFTYDIRFTYELRTYHYNTIWSYIMALVAAGL